MEDDVLARLINMPNVILSSHQAFLTKEALSAISQTTLKNVMEFFIDQRRMNQLTNYVGPPEPPPALIKALSRKSTTFSSPKKSKG